MCFADTGKHHTDDTTSSSSCGAETMAATTIKRETHTPTTDQSEDSGVDVSAAAACGMDDARGPYKRRRTTDYGDGCPTAVKSSRTAAVQLSVNLAVVAGGAKIEGSSAPRARSPPPFRPWSSSDESASDVGLRLFHDIRNVDRILTLTQRRREPPPEPQPLDLTKSGRTLVGPGERDATAEAEAAATRTFCPEVIAATVTAHAPVAATSDHTTVSASDTVTRYSKNMSRARRIEANARERSRVHTISAAFDTLRASVPSYSKNQKLSKLSTIRIASAYILTLSRLLDMDYSAAQDSPSVAECVNNITGIIHMEGKVKKKKDEP